MIMKIQKFLKLCLHCIEHLSFWRDFPKQSIFFKDLNFPAKNVKTQFWYFLTKNSNFLDLSLIFPLNFRAKKGKIRFWFLAMISNFLDFKFEFLCLKSNFDFLPQNSNLNFRAKNGKNKYFEFYHKIQKISLKYFIDKYLIWIFSLKFTFMIYAI